MRYAVLCIAAAIALASASARAGPILYSFETGTPANPDGFGPNGGGVTVAQDTVGATDGPHSMKVNVVTGATFVGALTGVVHPLLNDPPGVTSLLIDMTVSTPYAGGFALMGVTVFGASQPGPGQQFGLQAQFADFEHIDGKGPGIYQVQIDLLSATNPLTFDPNQTFNQIFGTVGSGPNDLIPTGFQLFFNKSNDAPLVVNVDKIQLIPEPASAVLGIVGFGALALRRRRQAA